MSFATGLVTGLASGFDKMLQLDMKRNFDKMSRAEEYALRMREAKKTRLTKDEDEIKDALKEIATISGSNARAEAIAESVGGTKDGILRIRDTLRENQETLGDKFDVSKVYDFADVDNFATTNPIQFSDMLRKYGPKYVEDTQVAYQPTGFQKLFGKPGKTEQELVGDLVEIPERFREGTDQLFADRPDVSQPNYGKMVKAIKFEAEMEEKYGSPTAALTDLTQKMDMADNPDDKANYKKQIDSMFQLYTQLEKAQADAIGSKVKSAFSKPSIDSVFKTTEDRYTKPYFEVDLEGNLLAALEGTQAQTMKAKMDAYTEIENRFTTQDGDGNPLIDPQVKSILKDRRGRVDREVSAYKNTELSKFQNQDANAKFDEVATKQEAIQNIKDNKYPAGTVISFKENNVTKMIIWTGTGVL
tara:strand:- start:173 stop:1420 length:1248 start_codon:yes stop_codon:yes gene_type:complete